MCHYYGGRDPRSSGLDQQGATQNSSATLSATVLPAASLPSSSSALAISTSFRPGIWTEQILKFETQRNPPREFLVKEGLAGVRRDSGTIPPRDDGFPVSFLLSALDKLLCNRTYSSSDLVNPLVMKRAGDQVSGGRSEDTLSNWFARSPSLVPSRLGSPSMS